MAEAVSVHTLACYPVATYGTDAQRKRFLPDMIGGELLGAYCLSEPAGRLRRRVADAPGPSRDGDDYVVTGTKAWITHAGVADFYNVFCRTGGPGAGRHLLPARRRRHARHRAAGPGEDDGPALLAGGADRASTAPGSRPTG